MDKVKRSKEWLAPLIIVLVLVIDQCIKIWVKTNMTLGQQIEVTPWFKIDFIENSGMAWGMTFFNKYALSLFRIVAVILIGWYLHREVKRGIRTTYLVFLSLILAGAAGNIFDSMFYGLVFNASSPYYVSWFVPFGQGYGSFLTGKVVDMFYFPLIQTTWPQWMPIWGGREFVFFDPVFNFADASITVGVFGLILFCRKDLATLSEKGEGKTDHSASRKGKSV